MEGFDEKITELEDRIDHLVRTQIGFQSAITSLREELKELRQLREVRPAAAIDPEQVESRPRVPPLWEKPYEAADRTGRSEPADAPRFDPPPYRPRANPVSEFFAKHTETARNDLEKFIGENLISKIGILVLIIGIGIGVKYSIDNDLVSPVTRIVAAYLFGFGLVGLAIKLKPRYLNFSAALMSGGMATIYFVTYFGYTTYGLIDRYAAFGLMAASTVFTVAAAIVYNRQVIAHIGLVGAYAVPFLLSTESGNVLALFSYMSVINTGILAVSVRRNWRPIFYTASGSTWIIFFAWLSQDYSPELHFDLALTFLGVFAAIFLGTKLLRSIVRGDVLSRELIAGTLLTALIFYSACFVLVLGASSNSQAWTFFSYLAAAALALVAISLRFLSRLLLYISLGSVWLIFAAWYLGRYSEEMFLLAAVFSTAFFLLFYASAIMFRLRGQAHAPVETSALVLTNSFVYYGFGYAIMSGREETSGLLGLFTAGHSAFHLAAALLIGRIRPAAVDVVQVLGVLVLTFATIAIPIQLDGNQVTMAWAVEAALLFWFGRSRNVRVFESYSYPVMLLATASLFFDWGAAYLDREFGTLQVPTPLANGNFVTAMIFIAGFAVIYAISRDRRSGLRLSVLSTNTFSYIIAGLTLFVLYNALRIEISNYFGVWRSDNAASGEAIPPTVLQFKSAIWQVNYSMIFLAAMALLNKYKVRSFALAAANGVLGILALGVFATAGMAIFYELREIYMSGFDDRSLISIRYVSYTFAAGLVLGLYILARDELLRSGISERLLRHIFETAVYSFCFVVASCELVNSMVQLDLPGATKLGLSILWGLYALMLIILGIAWNRKHLRIAAIGLLTVILLKLFFYDVADLDTIPRTILFVTLGLTLLLISFLYNKYKNAIFGLAGNSQEEP